MSLRDYLKNFRQFFDESCDDVISIKEINDKYDYEDDVTQGENDERWVACGQDVEGYNELENIFEEVLTPRIDKGIITEGEAIKALCKACRNLDSPRDRDYFCDRLEVLLEININ